MNVDSQEIGLRAICPFNVLKTQKIKNEINIYRK